MQKHTLFIADLHLSEEKKTVTELFLRFLKNRAPEADALYILGDLFKLWIGDDDPSPYLATIKAALKELSTKIPVFLMPGNRDFLLGNKFEMESGCRIISDPSKIDLYGTSTLLTHGDSLYTNDKVHVFFRYLTRPKINVKIFLMLPFKFRATLAYAVQRYSMNNKKRHTSNFVYLPQDNITKLLQKFNATQLIYGHIHTSQITTLQLSDKKNARCIILGEWDATGSVLVYKDDNTLEQQSFS